MDRVTHLVTDTRATQYWDAASAVADAYTEQLSLTGPCAGIFMIYEPGQTWDGDEPPRAVYLEDAHAREYRRPYPQWDATRFRDRILQILGRIQNGESSIQNQRA